LGDDDFTAPNWCHELRVRTAINEIAAMVGFRDTGTEAALRLRLADVGVRLHLKDWH
jgi:hypothetical protein